MKRNTVIALTAHIAVILAIIIVFGVISVVTKDGNAEGSEKFTGELERNVTLHVLENNTAKEQG